MKHLLLFLIRAYRYVLSPFIGQHCRFTPSCSAYALEAVERFGALKGGWMSLKRLGRCHPFAPGGYDPVPEADVRLPAGQRATGGRPGGDRVKKSVY